LPDLTGGTGVPPAFPATGIALEWHRPYAEETTLFLIGPGGVGKSTLGKALAARLGWELIDLDLVFCDRLAIIGDFIATHGYRAYRAANLALAETLVAGIGTPTIFVTASGFLVAPPESENFRRASTLVDKATPSGCCRQTISTLPPNSSSIANCNAASASTAPTKPRNSAPASPSTARSATSRSARPGLPTR
jgi:hypothetical protein